MWLAAGNSTIFSFSQKYWMFPRIHRKSASVPLYKCEWRLLGIRLYQVDSHHSKL